MHIKISWNCGHFVSTSISRLLVDFTRQTKSSMQVLCNVCVCDVYWWMFYHPNRHDIQHRKWGNGISILGKIHLWLMFCCYVSPHDTPMLLIDGGPSSNKHVVKPHNRRIIIEEAFTKMHSWKWKNQNYDVVYKQVNRYTYESRWS